MRIGRGRGGRQQGSGTVPVRSCWTRKLVITHYPDTLDMLERRVFSRFDAMPSLFYLTWRADREWGRIPIEIGTDFSFQHEAKSWDQRSMGGSTKWAQPGKSVNLALGRDGAAKSPHAAIVLPVPRTPAGETAAPAALQLEIQPLVDP